MLRTRTDLWRLAIFTSLGLCPNACGGGSAGDNDNPSDHATTGEKSDAAVNLGPGKPDASPARTPDASSLVVNDAGANAMGDAASNHTVSPSPDGATTPPTAADGGTPTAADGGTPTAADGGTPTASECAEVVRRNVYTGLNQCHDGVVHRPNAAHLCSSWLPRKASDGADGAPPVDEIPLSAEHECDSDADCKQAAHGYCAFPTGENLPIRECFYGCVSDADCASDEACVCGDPVGTCVAATCRDDNDCSPGMKCAEWVDRNVGCGLASALSCQTAEDECATDADCDQNGEGDFCSAASGVRQCEANSGEVCGRPFLVAGSERLAELTRSQGWCDTPTATTGQQVYSKPVNTSACRSDETLSEAERQRLGQRWANIGLMEHASIAAFARFTLQLLHLGAPAVLVREAQRAMQDETEHAQHCFALARRYLRHPVGPGALRMDQALQETELADIVRLTVREGCIGETCAALEAAEACEATLDPATKLVLEKIRVDEFRHAELAWRFVSWALTEGAANAEERVRLRLVVAEEFAAAAREASTLPSHPIGTPDFDTMAHGLVPQNMLPVIRRAALYDVVSPCARGLLRSLSA